MVVGCSRLIALGGRAQCSRLPTQAHISKSPSLAATQCSPRRRLTSPLLHGPAVQHGVDDRSHPRLQRAQSTSAVERDASPNSHSSLIDVIVLRSGLWSNWARTSCAGYREHGLRRPEALSELAAQAAPAHSRRSAEVPQRPRRPRFGRQRLRSTPTTSALDVRRRSARHCRSCRSRPANPGLRVVARCPDAPLGRVRIASDGSPSSGHSPSSRRSSRTARTQRQTVQLNVLDRRQHRRPSRLQEPAP